MVHRIALQIASMALAWRPLGDFVLFWQGQGVEDEDGGMARACGLGLKQAQKKGNVGVGVGEDLGDGAICTGRYSD